MEGETRVVCPTFKLGAKNLAVPRGLIRSCGKAPNDPDQWSRALDWAELMLYRWIVVRPNYMIYYGLLVQG